MKTILWKAALPIFALAFGCGPSWVLVKQATPNPLVGQKNFSVDLVNFDSMLVGRPGKITEAEWVAKKKPEDQPKFQADLAESKQRLNQQFVEQLSTMAVSRGWQLATAVTPGTFVIKPVVVELEPGYNIFISRAPATVKIHVHIFDPAGAELDVLEVVASADAGSYGKMADRLGVTGQSMGNQAARYIDSRTQPPKQ